MAERRMFAKTIIDSDAFLEMPLSSQALYFHLSMRADDDGFVNNPNRIARTVGANKNDLDVLIGKRFILTFDSGVIVIKHWRINNYLQNDRAKPTIYQEELAQLELKDNKAYTEKGDRVYILDTPYTQDSIGENRVDKNRLGDKSAMVASASIVGDCDSKPLKIKAEKHKNGQFGNVLLTDAELDKIKNAFPIDGFPSWKDLIEYLSIHIEMKGYKAKSHYLAILKWVCNAVREEKQRQDRLNGKGNNYTAFQKGNKGLDIEVPWLESYIQSLKSTPDEKQPQKYGKQNLPEVEIPWLDEYWKETKTGGNS